MEHKAATRQGELETSAIAEHAWKNHHQVLWDQTRALDEATNMTGLLVKEALHIKLPDSGRLVNRDELFGLKLRLHSSRRKIGLLLGTTCTQSRTLTLSPPPPPPPPVKKI